MYSVQIEALQQQLQEKAEPKTKDWWEAYMKHVIPFRGVKMPVIRAELHQWYADERIESKLNIEEQKDLALTLFRQKYAEDKLAGILFMQEILLPAGAIVWPEDVPRFATLFTNNWIYDWNICDWFCVKVLGPLIKCEGTDCAAAIAQWHTAENLWQARAAVVAFVNLVSDSRYYPLIQNSCQVLIKRDERFAKTAVGWILRDISKYNEPWVKDFLTNYLHNFSKESLRNATKYFDQSEAKKYLNLLKEKGNK